MALNQNEKMEQIDDSEEQYPVTEEEEMGSSSLDSHDSSLDKQPKDRHRKSIDPFRQTLTRKVEIKDLVKAHVLHFLPAKSLIQSRSVSTEWDQWITNPLFALHQSYFFRDLSGYFCQYDEGNHTFLSLNRPAYGIPVPSLRFLPDIVNIRSSSGGLLLCQGRNNNSYYICNPATKKWKQLPDPKYYHDSQKTAVVLAFEPSLLNIQPHYQVICAVPLHDQPGAVCFEVYSSEMKSWKQSVAVCVHLGHPSFQGYGFYMNRMAYWETTKREVLAFDVTNDTFEIISLPSESPLGGVLTRMQDELCYIGFSCNSDKEYSLKIYGGMRLQSKGVFDLRLNIATDEIQGYPPYRVLPCLEDSVVMILVRSSIFSYRLKDQSIELMSREGVVSSWATITYLPYVNSLVCVS